MTTDREATDERRQGERQRAQRGVTFYASKPSYDDLAVVIKRFPRAASASDGRPFVLVHGIGVSSRYFHPLAVELAKSGEVFLIDLPGYGSAPKPHRDVSIKRHANVLFSFLEKAGITNPVLVGHSMGTQVVSQLALDRSEVTDRLVLIAPTIYPPERSLARQALNLSKDMVKESLASNLIILTDYFLRCGFPYYLAQTRHLLGDHIEDRLPQIEASTLVLRGDSDPIVPRAWGEAVAELMPNATFAEVDGPHVVMHSDPLSVARLIVRHSR